MDTTRESALLIRAREMRHTARETVIESAGAKARARERIAASKVLVQQSREQRAEREGLSDNFYRLTPWRNSLTG